MERPAIAQANMDLPKRSRRHRWLTIGAMALMKRRRPLSGGVWPLPFRYVIKYGIYDISEAETLCFIARTTSIPVPKLFSAFMRDEKDFMSARCTRCYMVMRKMPGKELRHAWHTMSSTERESILNELRQYMDQLRSFKSSRPGVVGSVTYGRLNDKRVEVDGFGPYNSVSDFQEQAGCNYVLQKKLADAEDDESRRLAEVLRARTWDTRFTHADLNSANTLVHRGKISAIIDWERSGWFPEYYEYTSAYFSNLYDSDWWVNELAKVLHNYDDELEMETLRHQQFTFVS